MWKFFRDKGFLCVTWARIWVCQQRLGSGNKSRRHDFPSLDIHFWSFFLHSHNKKQKAKPTMSSKKDAKHGRNRLLTFWTFRRFRQPLSLALPQNIRVSKQWLDTGRLPVSLWNFPAFRSNFINVLLFKSWTKRGTSRDTFHSSRLQPLQGCLNHPCGKGWATRFDTLAGLSSHEILSGSSLSNNSNIAPAIPSWKKNDFTMLHHAVCCWLNRTWYKSTKKKTEQIYDQVCDQVVTAAAPCLCHCFTSDCAPTRKLEFLCSRALVPITTRLPFDSQSRTVSFVLPTRLKQTDCRNFEDLLKPTWALTARRSAAGAAPFSFRFPSWPLGSIQRTQVASSLPTAKHSGDIKCKNDKSTHLLSCHDPVIFRGKSWCTNALQSTQAKRTSLFARRSWLSHLTNWTHALHVNSSWTAAIQKVSPRSRRGQAGSLQLHCWKLTRTKKPPHGAAAA